MIKLVTHKKNKKTEQSFNSLCSALEVSREQDCDSKKIEISNGEYFLEKPLQLDTRDTGLEICGQSSASVNIYGGQKITGWKQVDEKLWCASLPDISNDHWDFRMLTVNNRFAERSRLPETGTFIHDTEFKVKWLSTVEGGWERPATDDELLTLNFLENDISKDIDIKSVELTIFHMWDESLVGVDTIDYENKTIRFANKPGYPPGAFSGQYEMERRYVVWNTKQGMTKPGQWYLDKNNSMVYYWPLDSENMETATVIVPIMDNIIRVVGQENNPVERISLSNLTLSVTNAPLMTGAFGAKLFDGAVSMQHVKDCDLSNLNIINVAGHALKIDGKNIQIKNCEINYTGASAIRFTGRDSIIENNYIHHVGQIFPSAIALYVGMTDPNVPEEWDRWSASDNVKISHNELHDTPYTAIACGGKNHVIEHNLIYRAMQDLYDGAGIYITFCENVIVRQNFVKDIKKSAGAGTSAYYMDEGTENALLENNISVDVSRPMHNHISKNNTIRNNLFIMPGAGYYTIERSSDYVFEQNILIADDEFALYDFPSIKSFKNNIIFCKNGPVLAKELDMYIITKTYELPTGDDNVLTDPLIEFDEKGIVKFPSNSPARSLNINEIDVKKAGRLL